MVDASPPAPASPTAPGRPVRHTARTGAAWDEFRGAASRDTNVLGKSVPFVGRRADLERTYDVVRDALNNRDCRALWLHGPAGIGKTRLLAELRRAVAPARRGVGWFDVRAGDASGPPTLLGRLLAAILDASTLVGRPEGWRLGVQRIADLVGERHALEGMAIVGPLIGVARPDADPAERAPGAAHQTELALQLVGSLMRARGRQGPLVVCVDISRGGFEEVPPIARALLEALVGISAALMFESRRAPPRGVAVQAQVLAPLPEEASAALVQAILQDVQGLPDGLEREILHRAGGVPERLVDLVRGMISASDLVHANGAWRWRGQTEPGGAPLLPVPAASGRDALPDRVARLPPELREIVDAAAIFGPSFTFGGVLSVLRGVRRDAADAMSDRDRTRLKAALMQLQASEVVRFCDDARRGADVTFSFDNPSDPVQLVAALPADARRLHARLAAQWLVARPMQDPVADPARIAELLQAGGRLRQAAERYLAAGEAARGIGQIQRAVELFGAGTRVAEVDDADVGADLRIALGGAQLRLGQAADAEPVLLEALRMSRVLEDDRRCGVAQLRIGQVARTSGRYEAAIGFLDGALKHFRVAGEHRWIADVMDELGLCHQSRGDDDALRHALAFFLKALALRRRSEDRRVLARSLGHIARIHLARGHFDDATDAVEEALQICEQIVDRWGLAAAKTTLGEVHAAAGRVRAAAAAWSQANALALELGDPLRRMEVTLLHAEAVIAAGEWQQAAALIMELPDPSRHIVDPELSSAYYRVQASISLEREAYETADLDSKRAVEVAREANARASVARALLVRGCVLGTRALSGSGSSSTLLDREATTNFDEALDMLGKMGDLVRQRGGLRSYLNYLTQRGGGPRQAEVEARLRRTEAELERVAGGQAAAAR